MIWFEHVEFASLGVEAKERVDHLRVSKVKLSDQADDHGGVLTETITRTQRPSFYKVILHNDDYTPMDFVVDILRRFFAKTTEQATEIMLAVHHKGFAICGVYPFEVAETKVAMVTEMAREHEYPLQCTLERAT